VRETRLLQTIFNNHIWQFLTLKKLHLTSLVGQTTTILGEPNLRYPRLEKVTFESFTDNDMILSAFSDFTIDTLSWKYNGPFSSFRDSIVTLNEKNKNIFHGYGIYHFPFRNRYRI
jgi:hypothetical protein